MPFKDIKNVICEEIAGAAREARNNPFARSINKSESLSSWPSVSLIFKSITHLNPE